MGAIPWLPAVVKEERVRQWSCTLARARQQPLILRVTFTPRSDCSDPLFVQGTAKLVVKVQTWDAFLCKRLARASPGWSARGEGRHYEPAAVGDPVRRQAAQPGGPGSELSLIHI